MKNIFSILMLLLTVTAAWAGEGDGSKEHPFTGEWNARDLYPKLEEIKGKDIYLAYDCAILHGYITVTDSKLNNTVITKDADTWSPRDILGSYDYSGYDKYCKYNSPDDRKSQMFVITGTENTVSVGFNIRLTGYFSGIYDYAGPALLSKKVDDVDYYVINSDEDYETFRQLVATGNPYANAILENDITVTKPIGSGDPQFHYRGTFDGQEHTITVNIDNKEDLPCGLFQYTEPGCVIRNMKVMGTLTSGHEYLGSIVGEAVGTRIEKCVSETKLKNTATSTLPVTGGLIGAGRGVNFIENCAFIGEIDAAEEACGIIGKVVNNVEIRSCYVDAKFSNPDNCNQIMFKDDDTQILMNCYYCDNDGTKYLSGLGLISVSKDDLSKGKCSYRLNLNGRKGVVWYQHGDHPYPFKGEDGQLVVAGRIGIECAPEHYFESNGICLGCGALDPNRNIAPLQLIRPFINEANDDDEIKINNLRFKTNEKRGLTTAELRGYYNNDALTAVHIPETINVNGEVYTIDYIAPNAFKDSKIEYCYIPKTVKHVEKDAFDGCTNLSYLHIADCPSTADRLLLEHKGKDHALFADCSSLKKVYIGRDMEWGTGLLENPDEPFEGVNSISDIFIGPRVSRLGNYYEEDDPREGWSYDLFNDDTGVKRVYIMGDDQSFRDKMIEFWCVDGLGKATDYYINRSVKATSPVNYFAYTPGLISSAFVEGCLDNCAHVTYGPFVSYITKNSFRGAWDNNNTTLKSVDFTNAFRLEEIDIEAFAYCHIAVFASNPFNNCMTLRKIGGKAFTDCDGIRELTIPKSVVEIDGQAFDDCDKLTSLVLEDGDEKIIFYGDAAFNDCDILGSIYHGRNFEYRGESPYEDCDAVNTLVIGPKVTKLNYNGYKDMAKLGALSFLYSPTPLVFESLPNDVFEGTKPRSMFIDRELKRKNGDSETDDLQFGSYFKDYVNDLSFGDHVTSIAAKRFADFKYLKTVLISASVETIGEEAFNGCTSLETVSALGNVKINSKAFYGCTKLAHLFLMGQNVQVASNAFGNCNAIAEVATGFYADPPFDKNYGYDNGDAFTDDVYAKASLICAGDTRSNPIVLDKTPWKKFQNRKSMYEVNDYEFGNDSGNYEHGTVQRSFNENYAFVYVPFDIDPYYFGADAEIYALEKVEDKTDIFSDDVDAKGGYLIDNIYFEECNKEDHKTLHSGVYLIKTNYPAESLEGFHSYFDSELLKVDNTLSPMSSTNNNSTIYAKDNKDDSMTESSSADQRVYVCEDGVLKLVNGEYDCQPDEAVVRYPIDASYPEPVFNFVDSKFIDDESADNDSKTILSSKIDLPFNALFEGYATFYAADYNYVTPEWCKVYVITSAKEGEDIEFVEIEDHTITKGQAVLLRKPKESETSETSETPQNLIECLTFATNGSSETALYGRNLLKGVDKDTPANELSDEGFVYVLSCNSNYQNPGFYKLSGDRVMPAGKAYLDPSGLNAQALAKSCLFVFSNEATGIKSMSESTSESIYDLMGRRLKESGFKGVYIVNGKKVVIK